MTNEATETDHTTPGHSCAHCAGDEDHHALDEKGIVDGFRNTLRTAGVVRSILALSLIASAAMWAPVAIGAGVLAWIVATGVGIAAMALTKPRFGTGNAVILGTAGSAAVLPVLAWACATWIGASPAAAMAAGSGWFLAVAIVEFVRDRKLSTILIADSRDGEAARQGVLFNNPVSPWVGLAWALFTAAIFGAWVWVLGMFPLALLPAIPLQVVLALLSKRGSRN